jgi:hypothetical protein
MRVCESVCESVCEYVRVRVCESENVYAYMYICPYVHSVTTAANPYLFFFFFFSAVWERCPDVQRHRCVCMCVCVCGVKV